jgi:hypothetical protein
MIRVLCTAVVGLTLASLASAQTRIEVQAGPALAANSVIGTIQKIDGDKITVINENKQAAEYSLAKECRILNGRDEVKEGIKSEMLKEGTPVTLMLNNNKEVVSIQLKASRGLPLREVPKKEDK